MQGNHAVPGYEAEYAERTEARIVLIFFRADGRGGIQGIIFDSFYMNKDGRIANEFYYVKDSEEAEIEPLNDSSIRQLTDGILIQKAFYDYFLK